MKKLILLASLILIAGLCFAQEAEDSDKPELFDLEVTVGVPIHWTNSPTDHKFYQDAIVDEDKTVTANTAMGVALLFNFTKKIGMTLDTDFFFGADLMGHSPTDSGSNTLFGANALLGAVIYLYNGSFLRIPLAIGVHMSYWSSDSWVPESTATGVAGAWIKSRDLQLGPGLYIGIQFHFNENIYVFSRTNVAVGLFRWHQITAYTGGAEAEKETHTEMAIAWHVKPALGIGIKF